ncbi:unnamed protein product [Phytophthora fragariaefolia]|uniref:Unnamed protein product n=1 Tax=Phytophthora fragariaefolia TaxID=1490495 RepID=A0A9W7D2G5_9STRA|nr:unnamed protein product [Phytophthora fragariaefolia]
MEVGVTRNCQMEMHQSRISDGVTACSSNSRPCISSVGEIPRNIAEADALQWGNRSEWREQNPGTNEAMTSDEINAVVNKYWSFAVVETLSSIWRARVDFIYNTTSPRSGTNDRDALFWARLQTGFDVEASTFALDLESAEEWAIAMNMMKHLREARLGGPEAQFRSPPQTAQFIGFFDAGKPGSGGEEVY